jgi:hypothetical protein
MTIDGYEDFAWFIAGAVWWALLSPSVLGLLLMLVALTIGLRRRVLSGGVPNEASGQF